MTKLPNPRVRFTMIYSGDDPLPPGTPRSADWNPDGPTLPTGERYRLFIPTRFNDPEEWLTAVAELRAGRFPSPPSNEQPDPFADERDLPPYKPPAGAEGFNPEDWK